MGLTELTSQRSVYADITATSKKALFQEVSHRLAQELDVDARDLFAALIERERLGSTGMGRGVAVPHCRLPALERIHGALVRLAEPIPFDAVDGQPVDLFYFLAAPEGCGAEHLRALARVSRALRNPAVLERLRGAASTDSLFAALCAVDRAHAA